MKRAFEENSLGGIKLKNRIIRSATHEGMADSDGRPTEKLEKLYTKLAKGGAGLIITGYAAVDKKGVSHSAGMLRIDNDSYIDDYKKLTETVHRLNTPIVMQIAHCGRQTRSKITGSDTYGPSPIRHKLFREDKPRELSEEEINELIENFVSAIERAKEAGFDGVQLHLAHGYLLSDFLSSYSNRRKDQWGGSLENRFRVIKEILTRSKERIGDFPIMVKINGFDSQRKGMRIEESIEVGKLLESYGCIAVEVSNGTPEDGMSTIRSIGLPVEPTLRYNFSFIGTPKWTYPLLRVLIKLFFKNPREKYNYNMEAATRISQAIAIPVIGVGGIHSMKDIEDSLEGVDYISMSRPFIIEPDIVHKLESGSSQNSLCKLCNYCMILGEERTLKCYYGRLPKKPA